MKQKIFELLDKNFKRENIGTCNYWIFDGRIVASECECPAAIDVYFDIDVKASIQYKNISTYITSKRIDYSRFDEFEKRLNAFITETKNIRKMIRRSMIKEL